MGSPDATRYIDLLLRDLDPIDLYDIGVQTLGVNLPQLTLRDGSIETVMLESHSVQIAELIYAINQLPSAIVQILLKMNGIEFDPGEQPTVDVLFSFNTTSGVTIPEGTSVIMELDDDLEPMTFSIDTDVDVPPGQNSATITMRGDRYSSEANGYPANTAVTIVDSLTFVNSVVTATPVENGRDEESDDDYFSRGTQVFTRQTNTLVLPRHFTSAALEESYVQRVRVVDNYNYPSGSPGSDPGYLALFTYGYGGPLTAPEAEALHAKLSDLAAANLNIQVGDAITLDFLIDATIVIDDDYVAADVIENVKNALRNVYSIANWQWADHVRRNDVLAIIGNATGVRYVKTLTTPAADVNIPIAALIIFDEDSVITVEAS